MKKVFTPAQSPLSSYKNNDLVEFMTLDQKQVLFKFKSSQTAKVNMHPTAILHFIHHSRAAPCIKIKSTHRPPPEFFSTNTEAWKIFFKSADDVSFNNHVNK